MITIIQNGDLLDSCAQTLVNTINCEGVMGKGIALRFKERFPKMYAEYKSKCEKGQVVTGKPYIYKGLIGPAILNFPTKNEWKSESKIEDIKAGLEHLTEHYKEWGILSLAVPPLGCGQGGLDWRDVGPLLFEKLSMLDIPVELYAPPDISPELANEGFLAGSKTVGESRDYGFREEYLVIGAILDRIYTAKYHRPVGKTIFSKICFFATAMGLPTGLNFRMGRFGLESDELGAAARRMLNSGITSESRKGNLIEVAPGENLLGMISKHMELIEKWSGLIERVADLFLRISDSTQAELYAELYKTQYDLLNSNGKNNVTEMDLFRLAREISGRRKSGAGDTEIASAIRGLGTIGILSVAASDALPVNGDL